MKTKIPFTYVTWKEGKYYVSQCLNVEISSFGKTSEQSLENVQEAVALFLEDSNKKVIQRVEMPSITITSEIRDSRNIRYA